MKRYYCNGKEGYCERYDGCDLANCQGCEYGDGSGGYEVEKTTQFDRLKGMTVEQFADFLNEVKDCCYNFGRFGSEACEECPLQEACDLDTDYPLEDWLESEVENG